MFVINITENRSCNSLQRFFFSQISVKRIQWQKFLRSIHQDDQEEIINRTVNCRLILKYPIKVFYQKQFLKAFIHFLERQESTIADSVFDALGRLVALPSDLSNFCYSYHLITRSENSTEHPLIILKENINIISEGTTGLKVWQASKVLAEWVLQNPSYVNNKSILELGSGIGLTGLVVSSLTSASKYILTDCHPTVLSVLSDNVKINTRENRTDGKILTDVISSNSVANCTEVQVQELCWEKTTTESCKAFGRVDLIFATDVVYDSDLFQSLLNTVTVFLQNGTEEAIFACTERNCETLRSFWNVCEINNLKIEFLKAPEPVHLSWQSDIPIILAKLQISAEYNASE